MSWFRLYDEVVDDPKVQKLPLVLFRAWINCLCIAKKNGGILPSIGDIAYRLHVTESRAATIIHDLFESGLLESSDSGIIPHNWDGRQFESDTSRERTRRWRAKRHGDVTVTPSVTDQSQSTDTESEQIQRDIYGEFRHVKLTSEEHGRLKQKLNGSLDSYIDRFDRWVEENPKKTKDRKAYPSILMWFERDKTEKPKESRNERIERSHNELLEYNNRRKHDQTGKSPESGSK